MSQLRTNAILDASGGNTATINTVPLRPGVLDPENRIINGAFDFWQRGTSSTADGYGAADRWRQYAGGGTVTQSRQSHTVGDKFGSSTPQFYLRQTASGQSATGHIAAIAQLVEGVRSYAGETITVLGWVRRSSGSGNMVVEAEQSFGTGGSPSSAVNAISPTTITLTSSWAPFAAVLTVPSITGKTLGTNGNDFLQIAFWTSAGSDFNARTNSLGLQTIGVDLWGVHIKVGTHTTAATTLYKQPELGPELARCQRYCVVYGGQAVYERLGNGETVAATSALTNLYLPTAMRGTPSVSFGTVSDYRIYSGNTFFTPSALAGDPAGTTKDAISVSATISGATIGRAAVLLPNNSLTPRMVVDAEL
jgi:hypothetical protein